MNEDVFADLQAMATCYINDLRQAPHRHGIRHHTSIYDFCLPSNIINVARLRMKLQRSRAVFGGGGVVAAYGAIHLRKLAIDAKSSSTSSCATILRYS